MKELQDMTLQELDEAKYALDQEMRILKNEKRALPEDESDREQKVNAINEDLGVLRQRKLDIQLEQDARGVPLDPNAHVVGGAGGIQSGETFGEIGGGRNTAKNK